METIDLNSNSRYFHNLRSPTAATTGDAASGGDGGKGVRFAHQHQTHHLDEEHQHQQQRRRSDDEADEDEEDEEDEEDYEHVIVEGEGDVVYTEGEGDLAAYYTQLGAEGDTPTTRHHDNRDDDVDRSTSPVVQPIPRGRRDSKVRFSEEHNDFRYIPDHDHMTHQGTNRDDEGMWEREGSTSSHEEGSGYEQTTREGQGYGEDSGFTDVDNSGMATEEEVFYVNDQYIVDSLGRKREIDSRSINQPEKVKEWNEKFAGSDVTLFPKESAGSKGISVNYDLSQFHSEVESEKLDLERTKTIWEEKYAELNKQGEIERQAKSRLSQSRPPPTSSARSSVSQPPPSAGWGSGGGGGGGGNPRESAIDREIRLAQEREREMRREHTMLDGSAGKSAGKHGNYQQITAQTQHQVHHQPQQQHHQGAPPQRGGSGGLEEMTEVDQAAEMLKRSIIERDIQLQQQREHDYKHELPHRRATVHRDKEREQSEYEHREKEQERVNAHESVIERDIRLQRERDRDLNSSRSSTVTTSYSHHDITTTSSELGAAQASSGAGAVRSSPSMPAIRTASPPPANARGEGQHHETGNPNSPPQLRYEEAISTKAHAGESRIARELREQREREEELRARWHTMGVQSPMANTEPDTPYNMPEPKQKPVVGPSADRGHISKSESAHEMSAGRADGTDGKSSMSASVSIDSGLFRVHRVAPMKNADGSAIDESPEDAPHNETPIEREIRLTREREEELRREKGLPVASSAPKREVRVPVSATPSHGLHRRGDENTHRSGTIQRLASSRIHKEIESQRGREMLLRDEGKIKSVTSDDVDHHQKYVDIIPKEGHVAPPPQGSHREPKASAPPRDVLVSGPVRSKMYSAPSFSKTSAASHNANDALDNNSNKGAVQLEANSRTVERQDTPSPQPHHTATHHTATHHQHSNGSVVANGNINHNTTTHHHQQQQQHGGSTTRVAQQQQPQQRSSTVPLHEPAPGQHYSIRRAQNPTGSRIEQELREMKEREEELRRQHLAESGGGTGLRYGSPTPSLSVEGEGDRYDDSSSHAAAMVASANQPNDRGSSSVRRSALAAQWEKRITSTSSEQ